MTDRKIRVGIVGIGSFSASNHVPHLEETGKAEIAAVCRRNRELLEIAGKALGVAHTYTDWRQMIDQAELDAVIVSTPNNMHAECAVAAMEKGLHVLVEKPMALSSNDALKMISVSQKKGRVLAVGYNCRYQSHWRAVKKQIADGCIGKVRQISATYGINQRWFWEREKAAFDEFRDSTKSGGLKNLLRAERARDNHWRYNPSEAGGSLFIDVGTHLVDLMFWLVASAPKEVFAYSNSANLPVDAFITAQARLDTEVMLSLTFGEAVAGDKSLYYGKGGLTIQGDDGIVESKWSGLNPSKATVLIENEAGQSDFEPSSVNTNAATAFVEAVLEGSPNYAPPQECINTVLFTESVYRSMRDRGPVAVTG